MNKAGPMDDLDYGATLPLRGLAEGQTVFGRYSLQRILGRGGMGVVWLARDRKLERDTALKFLPDLVVRDKLAVVDLKRETKRCLDITHPNIVRVYDFLEDEATGLAAIAMEWVEGDNLSNLRADREKRCFEKEELVEIVAQFCQALDYAHFKAKVVHRDLKPANLMLTGNGELKVADFGIAKSLVESVSRVSAGVNASSGTLVYMSPQQALGRPSAVSDDIYALGATLYDLLTGRPPFYAGNIYEQVKEVVPPSLKDRREELGVEGNPIPNEWEQTILACLEKDPAKRPQSAGEVAFRLGLTSQYSSKPAPVIAQREVIRVPGTHPIPVQRRTPVWVLGLVALVVCGGFAAWRFGEEQQRREATRKQAIAVADEAYREAERLRLEKQQQNELALAAALKEANEKARIAEELRQKKLLTEKAREAERQRAAENGVSVESPVQQSSPGGSWENSLGMKFVPVAGTHLLFSVWDTRVCDYEAFARATQRAWPRPDFPQGQTHPAVKISWEDANAFCSWLTQVEVSKGLLKPGQFYRLPTDLEWSKAAGLPPEGGETPSDRDGAVPGYQWGADWPPPRGAGNYEQSLKVDSYKFTSPVGSFPANKQGLYDMGGNAYQWCSDWFDSSHTKRVLRGASWADDDSEVLMSSCRYGSEPGVHFKSYGFRCVLQSDSH